MLTTALLLLYCCFTVYRVPLRRLYIMLTAALLAPFLFFLFFEVYIIVYLIAHHEPVAYLRDTTRCQYLYFCTSKACELSDSRQRVICKVKRMSAASKALAAGMLY